MHRNLEGGPCRLLRIGQALNVCAQLLRFGHDIVQQLLVFSDVFLQKSALLFAVSELPPKLLRLLPGAFAVGELLAKPQRLLPGVGLRHYLLCCKCVRAWQVRGRLLASGVFELMVP